MSIAKSAQHEQPVATIESKPMGSGVAGYDWEGVPIDMYRALNIELGTVSTQQIERIRDVSNWCKEGLSEDTIGNRLQKLRALEGKLGQPGINETKVDKLWKWIKMDFHISELRKRQSVYER